MVPDYLDGLLLVLPPGGLVDEEIVSIPQKSSVFFFFIENLFINGPNSAKLEKSPLFYTAPPINKNLPMCKYFEWSGNKTILTSTDQFVLFFHCRKEARYLLPKPALSLREPRPEQWLDIVQEYFQATIKLTPIEAKAKFLEKLEKWTLFGSNFFFVSVCSTVSFSV